MSSYPALMTPEVIILSLHAPQRDHAANEKKRIAGMTNQNVRAFKVIHGRNPTTEEAADLKIVDGMYICGTHKVMLAATAC